MPNLKTYGLFISHAWKYGEEYDKLVSLLDSASFFNYRNYSAPSDKPLKTLNGYEVTTKSEIQAAIYRKIAPVNAVVVISGMYFNNRAWMEYEVDKAIQLGKPIVAVKPWGAQHMPLYISDRADEIVGWNTDSIVSAIRNNAI